MKLTILVSLAFYASLVTCGAYSSNCFSSCFEVVCSGKFGVNFK